MSADIPDENVAPWYWKFLVVELSVDLAPQIGDVEFRQNSFKKKSIMSSLMLLGQLT